MVVADKCVIDRQWVKSEEKDQQKIEGLGRYFLRTSMNMVDEFIVWNMYNNIREVESRFRALKTDLDLRSMYYKSYEATLAHLILGLLSYWLANTLRCELKSKGIEHSCNEIVRIGNTQKVITTTGYNKSSEEIKVRKCSRPSLKLKELQKDLNIKTALHKIELFDQMFNLKLSQGKISNMQDKLTKQCTPIYSKIKNKIEASTAVANDETGCIVNGRKW